MYFNELKIGMTVEIAPAVIEKQKMLEFAYTYDNIPLHTDEEYAKASPVWEEPFFVFRQRVQKILKKRPLTFLALSGIVCLALKGMEC